MSDKHDPHSICPQRISSEVYLKLSTPPASKSLASRNNQVESSRSSAEKNQSRKLVRLGPEGPVLEIEDCGDHGRRTKDIWEDQKAGGPKSLIAEEAEGPNNLENQQYMLATLIIE